MLYNLTALHYPDYRSQKDFESIMGQLSSLRRVSAPAVSMKVGQTAYVCVQANKAWNDSGIDVISGQIYNFTVPAGETWIDSQKICGADGYRSDLLMRPWEVFRRAPEAKWLQLIGTIGRDTRARVAVGSSLTEFLPPFPGRLYFFANDLRWMYWNNKGMVAVRVTRIQ
jgi:hypothetical protein